MLNIEEPEDEIMRGKDIDSELEASSNNESSSSNGDMMNTDGLLAVKDIEKLTGGHLDIKPLAADLSQMRPLVHTPKNAIRLPIDTVNLQHGLHDSGFLLFGPMSRPTNTVFKKLEDQKEAEK